MKNIQPNYFLKTIPCKHLLTINLSSTFSYQYEQKNNFQPIFIAWESRNYSTIQQIDMPIDSKKPKELLEKT